MQNSMMLVSSTWGENKTFKLIPISAQAPYNEVIFDVDNKVLAVISKEKKQTFHMMPKLDDTGSVIPLKNKRTSSKDYAEERRVLETFYEYFIEELTEIQEFIELFAVNSDTFPYQAVLGFAFAAPKENQTVEV